MLETKWRYPCGCYGGDGVCTVNHVAERDALAAENVILKATIDSLTEKCYAISTTLGRIAERETCRQALNDLYSTTMGWGCGCYGQCSACKSQQLTALDAALKTLGGVEMIQLYVPPS